MSERRRESRYLCADLVRVTYQGIVTEAVLEDIAARGICIQLDDPIPNGTQVHVMLGDCDFEGEVCYCKFQEIGYFIGIRFVDASRWNTHIFEPQHLTDLQSLGG